MDGVSLIAISGPASGRERPPVADHSIMVRVNDVDQHYDLVKASGTRILTSPTNYPYGERQYTLQDPGGHVWTFSQSIVDVDPQDWGGTLYDGGEVDS